MTDVKHTRGVKVLLKIGNGADPEVFAQSCSINAERGITFTAGTNDTEVINCEDPEQLAWILREKTNLSCSINGAGLLNTPDVADYFEWLESPDPRNCKLVIDVPAADGGVVFSGAYHLTEFSITGNRGEKAQASVALQSDGRIIKAANA